MKKLLGAGAFVLAMAFATSASAQEIQVGTPAGGGGYKPFVVGAYMGMGMAHSIIKHDDIDTEDLMEGIYGIDQKPKPRFAGAGGAYFDFYLMEILALEGGIGFVGKGFRLKEDDARYWERMIYMEIPLGAKLNIKGFQVGLAVAIYFALSAKTKYKDDDNEVTADWNDDAWDDYKRFNLGPKLTLGYAIPVGPVAIVPGLNWSIELIDNAKGDMEDAEVRERNWNLFFTVGVEFGFGA